MGWLFGGRVFAMGAIVAVAVLCFLSPKISPLFTRQMFRGRRLTYTAAPNRYRALKALSERAELPRIPVLCYLPNGALNAFTVGAPGNAAIAISDGILRRRDENEISAVLAHEVSHIRHNDPRIMGFAALSNQLIHSISVMLQLALSRTREYRADIGAAELTGSPEPLASALTQNRDAAKQLF